MIRRKVKLAFWLAAFTVIALTGATFSRASETVLLPTDDAYGMQQNAGTVKNETELKATSHSGGKNKRSFLKFDLSTIPEGCSVDGVTLELYLLTAAGTSRVNQLYFIGDDSWTETSLTWNNQPVPSGLLAEASTGTAANTTIIWGGSLAGQVGTEYGGDKKISLLLEDSQEDNTPGAREVSYASKEHETASKPILRVSYTCGEREGCSHGFWKNHENRWPAGYDMNDDLDDYFDGIPAALVNDTLETALAYGGGNDITGAAKILLRNAVASLLNAAELGDNFDLTEAEVMLLVNNALASGDRNTILGLEAELDVLNNLGCPLGN